MLSAQELPQAELLQLHILNNRFVNRPMVDRQNGYELIQIGWSGERARPAGALIQGNHIAAYAVESEELFTLKASDIFMRNNTFVECQGSVNIRAGDRVLVQGNTFDGHGQPNTGGLRVEGADHVVIENTFRNLKAPRNYFAWPLSLMAADVETTGATPAGYGRARNILIASNRFEHNDARIAIGIYPRPKQHLLPRNILIQNNTFVGAATNSPCDYIAPDPSGALLQEVHMAGNLFLP
jgi:poly(beta-D-mannuronate) lyase